MNQQRFIVERQPAWLELEALLAGPMDPDGADKFGRLYRSVCNDLGCAQQRRFDAYLVDRLNNLVIDGHHLLYQPSRGSWRRAMMALGVTFPRAVRREWRLVLSALFIFYGAAAGIGWLIVTDPDMVYAVMPPAQVRQMEAMYDPNGDHFLRPRGIDTDTEMFGFYIQNNITIAFRSFASGIFFGIGSFFILFYNGLVFGAVGGHLSNVGFGGQLLQFVVGHGSLELTAVVLSAAAGLRLGLRIVDPGQHTRGEALRRAASRALPLVYGSFAMLVGAAAVEAFWSPNLWVARDTKLIVGGLGWLLTALFLLTAGVGHGSRAD